MAITTRPSRPSHRRFAWRPLDPQNPPSLPPPNFVCGMSGGSSRGGWTLLVWPASKGFQLPSPDPHSLAVMVSGWHTGALALGLAACRSPLLVAAPPEVTLLPPGPADVPALC